MQFKLALERWWLGANRAGLKGGAVGVKAFFATAGGSALGAKLGVTVAALTLQQAAVVFLFAFLYDFFDYLAANPMPQPGAGEASVRGLTALPGTSTAAAAVPQFMSRPMGAPGRPGPPARPISPVSSAMVHPTVSVVHSPPAVPPATTPAAKP